MQIKVINNVVLFNKYFERHALHLDIKLYVYPFSSKNCF